MGDLALGPRMIAGIQMVPGSVRDIMAELTETREQKEGNFTPLSCQASSPPPPPPSRVAPTS